MDVVCIGSGNVATHLAKALFDAGFTIKQVMSRTLFNAETLARQVNATWTNRTEEIAAADIYFYSVSDSALEETIRRNPQQNGLHVHTAGSMPLSLFDGQKQHYGVLYPLQTFSKEKQLDFSVIPLFVEANDADSLAILKEIAGKLSRKVYEAGSEQRQQLHLAAVFSCNFANHLFTIADALLQETGLPFEVLRPLIQETIDKTATLPPFKAQTGPAVRNDTNVMEKHRSQLAAHPQWQEIYRLISKGISTTHH